MPTMWNSNWGLYKSKWNLSIFYIVVHCSVQEVYIKVENGLHS
jgi:hypothetical protein